MTTGIRSRSKHRLIRPLVLLLLAGLGLSAISCSQLNPAGPAVRMPELHDDHVLTGDGYRLPLHRWQPEGSPERVVVALHGFNDYGASFDPLARVLSADGTAVYAYDQRGFGATEPKGIWAGEKTLTGDLNAITTLLRQRHPGVPLHVIGKSMGAAVAIAALAEADPPAVDGAVLIAPAIWGRRTMPWYQRAGLSVARWLVPRMALSGKTAQRVGVQASDDLEVLRALGRDPLVQKGARIDTLGGLTDLMTTALERAPALRHPTLLLYGGRDEIIPAAAMCRLLRTLPGESMPWQFVLYPGGYHMLTRYSGGETTHQDVAAWLRNPSGPLPSEREVTRGEALDLLCARRTPV